MGHMIDGEWLNDDRIPADARGHFVRADSRFRHWISADGSPGPTGEVGFKAEPGRYHLFVSPSCPWAHRTIIMRKLKNLEDVISMSNADRPKTEGWAIPKPSTISSPVMTVSFASIKCTPPPMRSTPVK